MSVQMPNPQVSAQSALTVEMHTSDCKTAYQCIAVCHIPHMRQHVLRDFFVVRFPNKFDRNILRDAEHENEIIVFRNSRTLHPMVLILEQRHVLC